MKTQSLKSLATLLGVAVVLNVSALAGPGPQPQFQPRKASDPKKATVTVAQVQKAPAEAKAVVDSRPTLVQVPGPHGVNYSLRGGVASAW
ncbi:MAG: hypothetical protein QOE70_3748 [Chthoniobacter sp.]|jgi:predicted membrane GTPase involved in stress response|nr:hypothetical protein [Chthoniobacter sp.]